MRRVLLAAIALAGCQTPRASLVGQPLPPNLIVAAERSHAPGIVGAILRDGRVEQAFAWGGAACDGAGTADTDAAYEIGSISKHITAVALLQLWERGRVDLDAPVGRYLDDIPEAWRAVTLRQLLTHTSGVPDYEEAGGYGIYETSPTPADVYAVVSGRPLDFEPGTKWSYSNTGYFLLSQVVQRVSGERFGDYLRNHVFEPLGMRHTFMGGYAPAGVHLAEGCRPGEGEGAPRIDVRPITEASTFGAGGVSSTLADWAIWDDALRDGRLLSPRGMRELTTTQHLADGEDTGYAFGLFIQPFRNAPNFSHSGQTQGFVAFYQTFPERGVGVIVFANQYQSDSGAVANGLVMRAVPELSYDRLPVTADPDPSRTALLRRALRQAVLGEQPADLLDDDTRQFATSADFASDRALMVSYVANLRSLEFLQEQIIPGADGPRQLYRVTRADGDTAYFRVGWRDGKLHRIRWDDE